MYEERSVTRRTALPLVAVAATFFLPMTDACDHSISPMSFVAGGEVGSAIWIMPTFVTAVVLAAAVFRSWRAKAKTALAFAAMGAFAITLPVLGVLFAFNGAPHEEAPIYAVVTLATGLLLERGRRKAGWERLSALLDAYAIAAAPLAITIATLAKYAGGYAFVIAYVAFATQRALVAVQSLRARRHTEVEHRVRVGADEPRARIGQEPDASLDDALVDEVSNERSVRRA